MNRKQYVLVLLALLVLVPCAQALAQTPPAAPVLDTAQFLATLSAAPAQAPNDLTPAPLFMTNCGDGPPCAQGQLCCYLCGNPPADGGSCLGCVTPVRGRCPMVV